MDLKKYLKSEFIKNSFTLLSITTIAQVIPILIYPLITRIYSPSEIGILSVFLSITGILSVLATGRYELAIMIPIEDTAAIKLVKLSILITSLFTAFSLLVIIILKNEILSFINEPLLANFLWLMPISIFLTGILQVFLYYLNRQKAYLAIGTNTLWQNIISSFTKLSIGYGGGTSWGLIYSTIIGQLAGAALIIAKVIKKYKLSFDELLKKESLKEVAATYSAFPKYRMLHAFSNTLSGNLPIIILTYIESPEMAGYFTLCMTIVFRPVNLFTSAVYQVLSKQVIEKMHRNEPIVPMLKKIFILVSLSALPVFIIFFIYSENIINIIFGSNWIEAGEYLKILLPWLYLVLLYAFLNFMPDLAFKQKQALIIDLIYMVFRLSSLVFGLYFYDIYTGLLFFSMSGVIILACLTVWYFKLAHSLEKQYTIV